MPALGQAEGEIVRRGFRDTGGSKGDDRSYVNWWNAATRRCVVMGTADGRYVSVQATTAPGLRPVRVLTTPAGRRRPSALPTGE